MQSSAKYGTTPLSGMPGLICTSVSLIHWYKSSRAFHLPRFACADLRCATPPPLRSRSVPRVGNPPLALAAPAGVGQGQGVFVSKHSKAIQKRRKHGLTAARAYAQAAAAVPHALRMLTHIFTRLGYWDESATMKLKGWEVSDADVKRAGESGAYRDFHNLNYLEYAYIQLGRYRDAQHTR